MKVRSEGNAAPFPSLTAAEAVQQVLTHLERQAGRTDSDTAYSGLLRIPELPWTALAALGSLTRLDESAGGETLPSLLLESRSGQIQIELCPFGPLALLSSDGDADTDPPAEALYESGIFPLFPADLDDAGPWHGHPLPRWLFPHRLPHALALFEMLRGSP